MLLKTLFHSFIAVAAATPLHFELDVAPSASIKSIQPLEDHEICLLVCFPEKPPCEKPSYAKQFGECWTCCVVPDSSANTDSLLAAKEHNNAVNVFDISHAQLDISSKPLHSLQDVCWYVCFPEKPECPPSWIAKQLGEVRISSPCHFCHFFVMDCVTSDVSSPDRANHFLKVLDLLCGPNCKFRRQNDRVYSCSNICECISFLCG